MVPRLPPWVPNSSCVPGPHGHLRFLHLVTLQALPPYNHLVDSIFRTVLYLLSQPLGSPTTSSLKSLPLVAL